MSNTWWLTQVSSQMWLTLSRNRGHVALRAHQGSLGLFFQASCQGINFGQAQRFIKWHHKRLPSAIKRYQDESLAFMSESSASVTGEYLHLKAFLLCGLIILSNRLVSGKPTIAYLSFVQYNVKGLLSDDFDFANCLPRTAACHKKLMEVFLYLYPTRQRSIN